MGRAAQLVDAVERVHRKQGQRLLVVQLVLDPREVVRGDDQRDARPLAEVDEAVAQGEVEQRVLPLLDPRGDDAGGVR